MDMTSVTYLASFEMDGVPLMTIPVRGAVKEPGEVMLVMGNAMTVQSVTWRERDGLLVCVMAMTETVHASGMSADALDALCNRLGRE